jgi:hypothetical protein
VREIELRITAHTSGHAAADRPSQQEFEELAKNLETVWRDRGANVRLKKRIVRTLIEEVVVDVDAAAGEIILIIHWKGGVHTELRLPRRKRGGNNQQAPKALIDAVRVLARVLSS